MCRAWPPTTGAVPSGRDRLRRLLGRAWRASSSAGRQPFTKVLDDSEAPFFKWFEDGTLNASYNCLDRNVERGLGDKTAIIFEADDGAVTKVTYKELLAHVCQLANALKARGVKKGDRVVIYMPMSVEGVVAMQACARIGATHSVVFGGFSAQSAARPHQRRRRGGGHHRRRADARRQGAAAEGHRRRGARAGRLRDASRTCWSTSAPAARSPGTPARDRWLHEELADQPTTCEPEWVERRAPAVPALHLAAPPASPRACSTPPAATCCTPR